jgi:hypothetical protein
MRWRRLVIAGWALGLVACGSSKQSGNVSTGGATAASDPGGGSPAGGGATAAGGTANAVGGATATSSGGSTSAATGGAATGGTSASVTPSPFSCQDLAASTDAGAADAGAALCYDFSKDDTVSFTPQGGTWAIVNGGYIGVGPAAEVTCVGSGSLMTATMLNNFSATDVRVRAKLTSLTRIDKVLILRERDPGNRIEVNFRATHVYPDGSTVGGDLVIQELVGCQFTILLVPKTVLIPHDPLQTISVDVQLRGTHFHILVDGNVVFDNDVPVVTAAGSVGMAIITNTQALFDDFIVEKL